MTSAANSPAFSAADPPRKLSRDEARAAGRRKAAEAKVSAVAPAKTEPEAGYVLPPRKGRERDVMDGTGEYRLVPIDDLIDDPDNGRKTYRDIGLLAASMREEGLLQPIIARRPPNPVGSELIIMFGHRRKRAALELNWQTVPTIIRYGINDAADVTRILAKQLIENSQRADPDKIEEARAIRYYMRQRRIATYAECAISLGHSLTWVTNRVALLDLDVQDQDAVTSGELTLLEAVKKSRAKTGNTRQRKEVEPPHFSDEHLLAGRAQSRCRAGVKADSGTHRPLVGGVACGECWEYIIRVDAVRTGLTPMSRRA